MSFTHNINNQSSIGDPLSWSCVQDKLFEEAIVVFPKGTQDKWEKIATQVLGKSPLEVRRYYKDLAHDLLSMGQGFEYSEGPVDFGSKAKETQRRRRVPWTEEEHGYKILIVFFVLGVMWVLIGASGLERRCGACDGCGVDGVLVMELLGSNRERKKKNQEEKKKEETVER